MAGVTIGYKGNTIATIQGSGSKTLKTAGKYCEGDISVDYVQEGGGGITPTGTKSITANGTYDVTNFASAAVNVPVGATNAYTTTMTLATHQSTNVALCTLPDDVYAHRNDDSFTVAMVNMTPDLLTTYDDFYILAGNNPNNPKVGNNTAYGVGMRKNSATAVGADRVFYPPKSTDNSTSLGGTGKFWLNGKVLTYKSSGYYLGAGTYMIVVFW